MKKLRQKPRRLGQAAPQTATNQASPGRGAVLILKSMGLVVLACFFAAWGFLRSLKPARDRRKTHEFNAGLCLIPTLFCIRMDAHAHKECPACNIVDAFRSECSACRDSMKAARRKGERLAQVGGK